MCKLRFDKLAWVVTAMVLGLGLLTLNGCEDDDVEDDPEDEATAEKVDDWEYERSSREMDNSRNVSKPAPAYQKSWGAGNMSRELAESENIGFAVGGAKDVNNMRNNVEEGFLPLPSDITCEGLFYDYYFDTGQQEEPEHLFEPSYAMAISPDPISREKERYLTVGLNSNLTEESFERKDLDLVVVVDVSGSMSSPFDKYYYDGKTRKELSEEERRENKMDVAKEALQALLGQLRPNDRLGIVVFNNEARLAKPMRKVEETDMEAISGHIDELEADGGTQMSAGMQMATELYDEQEQPDPAKREQRIIFLTDAMPNLGQTGANSLGGMFEDNAEEKIYTTFIGIGVDFNSELVETINKARGANHYTVHSPEQFKNRMDRDFELMVTPLVFNLDLKMEADGYEIEKVYGSPEADEATGELMKVKTLFPSRTEDGETKGGVVLLKLRRTDKEDSRLSLEASYEDRSGESSTVAKEVTFPPGEDEYYDNSGIRKAILLSRYAEMLRNWTTDQRKALKDDEPVDSVITRERGIVICPPKRPRELGQWERESVQLQVSDTYRKFFKEFLSHIKTEMKALDDEDLQQEIEVLKTVIDAKTANGE